MSTIINAAIDRGRAIALMMIAVLMVGAYAYGAIPKESTPDIPIPIIMISTGLDGISPEDSERLLVRPLETALGTITGLKTITGHAGEGSASLRLEFTPGFDADEAMDKVREAVDRATPDLADGARTPIVTEINTALFPILTVILSGPVPERALTSLADDLVTRIEALPGVLEVDLGGKRDQLLEVLIDPTTLETYDLSLEEVIGQISRNNHPVAAGAIEGVAGRISLKVPGLIEGIEDVMALPVKVRDGTVVRFADVATILDTYQDPSSFARIDGQPALALEIKKRSGSNIIETVAEVKAIVTEASAQWPASVTTRYMQDESESVQTMLSDLEANVITAIMLVMIVIVWALGLRSALLVGLSIPGAFLAGVACLYFLGYTMNLVVLFSLILVVGMLVDGAIVTTELADRRLQEGDTPRQAYAFAATRMAWPLIASTATTLSVFLPLLFWTGTVGEFMKFLPITVIITLIASLIMALIMIPVIGTMIGKAPPRSAQEKATLEAVERGDPRLMAGFAGQYARLLSTALMRPWTTMVIGMLMMVAIGVGYARYGNGVSFFPSVEPDFAQVQVRARDNLSIFEKDALIRAVEDRLRRYDEIASVYARTGGDGADLIGTIQIELTAWDTRRPAALIGETIRAEMAQIPGIDVQVQTASGGPSSGKPINLQVRGGTSEAQNGTVAALRRAMDEIGGFTDVTDTRALPGVEWLLQVNRSEAARFGVDISTLGQAVQLMTRGIKVADYRPDGADGTVDIRLRFPAQYRSLDGLETLRIPTSAGMVPISNFVTFAPAPRSGTIERIDQKRVLSIEANVAPGVLVNDQVLALQAAIATTDLPPGVEISFGGEAQDQQESMIFLVGAFISAIVMMFAILLIQFNSFYQAFVVMSAIIFSVAGVLFGLLVTGQPFGIVMGGIGVIALAGIVVNNNIVLIDSYNGLRLEGLEPLEAALRTGAGRLRPVVLTSVTTVLGLMPMVLGLNINFFTREIVQGAPSTQWWVELSSAIAGGLAIATLLTLIVTPVMLVLGEKKPGRRAFGRLRRWLRQADKLAAQIHLHRG